jgi:hypothetical protein
VLNLKTFACKTIDKVKPGNLIYLLGPSGPELALRVEHPGVGSDPSLPDAVVFHAKAGDRIRPLTRGDMRRQLCVDTGRSPTLLWDPPLRVAKDGDVDPGWICLTDRALLLTSYFYGGEGERIYWNLINGRREDPGAQFASIGQWKLGLTDVREQFVRLVAYPDDYLASS